MRTILILLVLVLIALIPRSGGEPPATADTIFANGNVYTVNDAAPHAEAVAVKNGRILFVGSNVEAKKYSGPQTRTIDLQGKTAVPGFTDSHYHILGVGERLMQLDLESATSREWFLSKVKEQAEDVGPGRWINGRGWICVALVVFASWRPGKALLGALLFAFFDALQLRLQQSGAASEALAEISTM